MSSSKQKRIVKKIIDNLEQMDEDEMEKLYDQLDEEHQMKVDDAIREFADAAVGSEYWDSDE